MRPSLLVTLTAGLVLAAAGCGGGARRATLPTGERAVAGIELVGVRAFEHDAVIEGLVTERARRAGQPFESALARSDRRRVLGQYVRAGYWQAQVEVEELDGKRGVTVTLKVVEGPRARLAAVEISGLPDDVPAAQVRAAIELDDGDPFDYAVYDRAKPALVALLERSGYAHGRVDAWVDADRPSGRATVHLRFEPGPRAHIGPVTVRGVDGALADAVRARLALREGAPYSSRAVVAAQAAVVDLGRFASVRVEPDRSAGLAEVPIEVAVVELPRNELRLGGGVGVDPTAYQVRGRAGYARAGFPEPLTTTRLDLRPAVVVLRADKDAEPRVDATAALDRVDLLRPRLRGEIETGYTYEALEAFTSYGPHLRLGLRTPIGSPAVSVAIGWQLRLLKFTDLDEAIKNTPLVQQLGLDERYRLGAYTQAVIVDLRDDPVAPRKGAYGEVRLEEGGAPAGGTIEYVKFVPELRGYLPAGPFVLATRARLGGIVGKVPVTQRMFAGGAYSQRGFPERRLAPTATAVIDGETHAAPYGGGALLELGAEVRVRLGTVKGQPIDAAVFLEGADVTEDAAQLDVGHLHWATGGGFRVPTPIGAIRVDVGRRLNRYGAGELRAGELYAYHLSIGEAF